MRLKQDQGTGFTVWLSASDTYDWAPCWPCSTLKDKRLKAEYDSNGLLDLTVNGKYPDSIDASEMSAVVSDFVKDKLDKDNVAYFVAVQQFL